MHQYELLKERLKKQIISGTYLPGQFLPSENLLGQEHSLNRHTVRRALEELHREGYISRQRGRRSQVTSRHPRLGLLSFKGFSEVLSFDDKKIRSVFHTNPTIVKWPEPFFFTLTNTEQNSTCIFLERLRYLHEKPLMLERTWFSSIKKESVLDKPFVKGSLFTTLLVYFGIEIKEVIQDISAISADSETANYLKVTQNVPLLYVARKYITNKPEFFVYSQLLVNTGEYALSNDNS